MDCRTATFDGVGADADMIKCEMAVVAPIMNRKPAILELDGRDGGATNAHRAVHDGKDRGCDLGGRPRCGSRTTHICN